MPSWKQKKLELKCGVHHHLTNLCLLLGYKSKWSIWSELIMSASPNTQEILDLADFRLELYGVLVGNNNLDAFRRVQICGVSLTLLYLPHTRVL
jgi:hypothetical protein